MIVYISLHRTIDGQCEAIWEKNVKIAIKSKSCRRKRLDHMQSRKPPKLSNRKGRSQLELNLIRKMLFQSLIFFEKKIIPTFSWKDEQNCDKQNDQKPFHCTSFNSHKKFMWLCRDDGSSWFFLFQYIPKLTSMIGHNCSGPEHSFRML